MLSALPLVTLPPQPCPHCGAISVPTLTPGRGPHVAGAVCAHCQGFMKWVPKRLFAKEQVVMAGVNRVVLVGVIGKFGIEVRYATSGSPCASFTLVVSEKGADGKVHETYLPCEVWGQKAEACSDLEAGTLVLFEGKLAKRKKGEGWELVVSGFDLMPLTQPGLTGRVC